MRTITFLLAMYPKRLDDSIRPSASEAKLKRQASYKFNE
jgi:hypothetical protein